MQAHETDLSPTESEVSRGRFGLMKSLERLRLPSSQVEIYPDTAEEGVKPQYQKPFATSPTFVALAHFVKALLGPTVLAMPGGFKHGGLVFSPPAYILLVLLITYNSRRLVLSAIYLAEREGCAVRTYDELAFISFNTCSNWTRNYARALKNTINILFFVTYLDACIIFMIFIGRNTESLLAYFCPDLFLDVRHFIFLQVSLFMLMSSFRDLKHLFPFSVLASVLMLMAIFSMLVFVFLREPRGMDGGIWMMGNAPSLMKFTCVVLFCFSGVSVALTLRSSMKTPENFFKGPSVFYFTLISTGFLVLVFGFFGYWKYGDQTYPSVLLNIPATNPLYVTLKVITILSVLLTTPFAFYVAFNIIWQNFFKHCFLPINILFAEYFMRYVLITACFLVAVVFPDLGWMIVLKGGLFHSQLEIILPAVLDYVVFYPEKGAGKFYFRLWKMVSICALGTVFFIGGIAVSILHL